MPDWESILEEYVEGTGSRASAESLRFRIALPPEARREVETVLRLADRLADATRSVRPPAEAARRLGDRLLVAGLPEVKPNWVWEQEDFMASDGAVRPGAAEDAVNAAIEGVGATAGSTTHSLAGRDGQRDLNAFRKIAAEAHRQMSSGQDHPAPAGAIDRLRSKLAEAREGGEGGASPTVAARILAQLRGQPTKARPAVRPPDVLAAGKEPEDAEPPVE